MGRRGPPGYHGGMRPVSRAALLALLLASPCGAATVHLRDGRRLTGTVVSATARDLELFMGGSTLRLRASDILRVDYGEDIPPAGAPPREASWREERKQQLGIDLGLSIPLGDVDFAPAGGGSASNGDVSASAGGHYLYFDRPRLGLGFAVEYLARGPTDSPGLLNSADSSVRGGSVALLGIMKYILKPGEPVQPFLLAGIGAARNWTIVDSQPSPGFVWNDTGTDETRRLVDGRAWAPAGTLRAGLDFWASSPAVFSLEAGWTVIGGANYAATQAGRAIGLSGVSGTVQIVTVGGRWGWRF